MRESLGLIAKHGKPRSRRRHDASLLKQVPVGSLDELKDAEAALRDAGRFSWSAETEDAVRDAKQLVKALRVDPDAVLRERQIGNVREFLPKLKPMAARLGRALAHEERGSKTLSREDLEAQAIALILRADIGPNVSRIAEELGVHRQKLYTLPTFSLVLKKARLTTKQRRRRRS